MLDHIRKHSKSWILKFILAFMTLGLVLFFGYSGLQKVSKTEKMGEHAPVAEVNGQTIYEGQFQQAYEAQLKFYEQIAKGNIPPNLSQNIKTGVLKHLIDTLLMAQQAQAVGLTISNKELAQEITSNPNFYKEGVFNKKFYLDQFKPYYERINGKDYEESLGQDILADKFEKFIRDSVSVSEEELKREFLLSNTELNLQKIVIAKVNSESNPAESQSFNQVESDILKTLSDNSPSTKGSKKPNPSLDALLKKYNLKTEETGFHSLRDKMAFVGDPNASEALTCIMSLSNAQALCPKAYPVGENLVLFKLIAKRDADFSKFDSEKSNIEKTLLGRKQSLVLQQISNALSKQASIQSYLKASS